MLRRSVSFATRPWPVSPNSILAVASSHIKAIGTPSPSPSPIEAGIFAHMDDTVAPLHITGEADFFPSEDFESHNAVDTTPEWGLDVSKEGITNRNYREASQALYDNPDVSMMDLFDVPNLAPNYLQSWGDGPYDLETELHHIAEKDYGLMMTYATKKSSLSRADNNLTCLLNSSPIEDGELNVRDLGLVSSPKNSMFPRSASHFGVMLQSRTINPVNAHSSESQSKIIQKATAYEQGLDPAIFCGTDPEMVTMSLLLLQKAVLAITGASMHKVCCLNSHTSRNLADIVNGDWLRSEIENLVCLGHETAFRSIRKRQASKSNRVSGGESEGLEEDHNNDVLASLPHVPRSKCIDYCTQIFPTGKLEIQLSIATTERSTFVDNVLSYTAQVCFVPNPRICATGVSALFSRINMMQSSVPTQITTFNVVPQDAEIIRRVRQGDIEGVRRLFERKQASARDVDPSGFSLLSVSKRYRDNDYTDIQISMQWARSALMYSDCL